MQTSHVPETTGERATRVVLGAAMLTAGLGHLTFARRPFQAQVPDWARDLSGLSKDQIVLASGVVEACFAAALLLLPQRRRAIGLALAGFFVAVFPGNIQQYTRRRSALGMDTDRKRFVRLFFQPVLVAAALRVAGVRVR